MTTTPPRRRHSGFERTRQSILDAAREIMREDGVAALSLNEVARRVGLKTPSLYTYFDSKNALYDALFAQGMRQFREHIGRILGDTGSFPDSLEPVIRGYMVFADENPDLYQLLFERPVPGFVPSAEVMVDSAAQVAEGVAAFQAAIDDGTIVTGLPARQSFDMFLALMHGLTALKRANEPDAAIGSGRFGSLVPAAAALLAGVWQLKRRTDE